MSHAKASPIPSGLHWMVVVLLSVVTFSVFMIIWMFVEAAYAQKLRTKRKPVLFYAIGFLAFFVGGFLSGSSNTKSLEPLFRIVGSVMLIAGHFSIKNALEDYYNSVEPINLQLSGVMTFFFNVLYFQYHFSKIRRWKLTGEYI